MLNTILVTHLFYNFQKTNTDFVAERSGQGHAAQRREAVLKELAAAHDAFMELTNNLKEGTKFYNDLTPVSSLKISPMSLYRGCLRP